MKWRLILGALTVQSHRGPFSVAIINFFGVFSFSVSTF